MDCILKGARGMRAFQALSVFLLLAGATGAANGTNDFAAAVSEYYSLAESAGPSPAAVKAREIVSRMAAENPTVTAWRTAQRRLNVISDAKLLTAAKLSLIAESGAAVSPFAFVAPTPAELTENLTLTLSATSLHFQGLDELSRGFVLSAEEVAFAAADSTVLEAYSQAIEAAGDSEAAEMARAYLSAYVLAVHREDLPAFMRRLAEETGDATIALLVVDAAMRSLGDLAAAARSIEALDASDWFAWPEGSRRDILERLAAISTEQGRLIYAATAYEMLAGHDDPEVAEPALMRVIELYAEEADRLSGVREEESASKAAYADAAASCAEYLRRFGDSQKAQTVWYLRSLYLRSAGLSEEAVAAARSFRERYADSRAAPNAMLIEALAIHDMGSRTEAIELFEKIVHDYPTSSAAGRAQFMAGYLYLTMQEYAEARERFQNVVDFYPNDPTVPRARQFLEQLRNVSRP